MIFEMFNKKTIGDFFDRIFFGRNLFSFLTTAPGAFQKLYLSTSHVAGSKKQLWGGEFWSDGYFMSMVGQHGTEAVIRDYVRTQRTEKAYQRLHHQQLALF